MRWTRRPGRSTWWPPCSCSCTSPTRPPCWPRPAGSGRASWRRRCGAGEEECDVRVFGEALAPWLGPRGRRPGAAGHRTRPAARARRAGRAWRSRASTRWSARSTTPTRTSCSGRCSSPPSGRAVGRRAGPVALRSRPCWSALQPVPHRAGGYRLENLFRVLGRAPGVSGSAGAGRVRIPGREEALAEVPVGLDAEPGQPGPAQVQRHLRRADPAAVGVDQQRRVVVVREARARPGVPQPRELRRARAARRGSARPARRGRRRRRPAAGPPGPARRRRPSPGSTAAAPRARRRPPRRTSATNPACAATPPLISVEAWWSSRTISARVTPSTADTAS